ncbi:MAG TPA: carboxypeptidase-like regulatory domain-containing protein [Pyrinomonadaceae bacterium]|nr:carboxypeptidase-like regulatory domain-containing protein [Pyrinomonadaceae bacterium]
MRLSNRVPLVPLVIALLLSCVALVSAQENPNKGGSITGRVTMANKGVAGVTVTITMSGDALSNSGLTLSAITDDEGRYRLSNLPSRTYFVWPFVPAFVVAEATGIYPQGKSVSVVEGEAAEGINFALTRGAVITGKITDATGRPVADERIRIIPVQQELRRLVSSIYPSINDIRTDDRGIYRAYGLPAGAYKVAVGDAQLAAFTSTAGRRFYPQTFHPDVVDEAKAKVVELAEGTEANDVDITVARAMTGFSVTGRFVDADNGQTVPSISYGLTIISGKETRGYISVRGVGTSAGTFQIDNLPPGTYAVSVLSGSSSGHWGASESFTIRDADLSDVDVKVHRGSTISGTINVEGTDDRSILARLSRLQIQAYTLAEGNSVGSISYSDINTDGSFQIGALRAGRVLIQLSGRDRNVAPEFALLAIDQNGADKSGGVQIKEGENISGIRLTLGYGTGIIRGTVRIEGGTLPEGAYLDAAFIRPGSLLTIGHTRVDARGQFVFERVPPGNYEVGVNAYLQSGRVSARQAVVTTNGVATEVTITLNVSPKTGP